MVHTVGLNLSKGQKEAKKGKNPKAVVAEVRTGATPRQSSEEAAWVARGTSRFLVLFYCLF